MTDEQAIEFLDNMAGVLHKQGSITVTPEVYEQFLRVILQFKKLSEASKPTPPKPKV